VSIEQHHSYFVSHHYDIQLKLEISNFGANLFVSSICSMTISGWVFMISVGFNAAARFVTQQNCN
jgi:hypothetical protein